MRRNSVLAVLWVVAAVAPAAGQDWATKMFQATDHDFGTVARAAKAEFEFKLSNLYLEDVHIASVTSSCGCTTPTITRPNLKTYEEGSILAHFNTDKFYGAKGATLTVTFDKPFYAQVQLHVRGYIRSDVVFHPGSVRLDNVQEGTPVEKKVAVNYAGRSDWRILEVKSDNPHITGEAIETSRGGGQVGYDLIVRTDGNLPAGYLQDHLVLITNDYNSAQVPVPVEGHVLSGITVSPTSLFMGVVEPGQTVTKKLVIRGSKPFRVLSVKCDGDCFECDTSDGQTPKTLHLIPITFVAGADPGKVTHTLQIETDLGQEAAPSLSAYAVVSAPHGLEHSSETTIH